MNLLETIKNYAILRSVAPKLGGVGLKLKTYSPELCVTGGIVAGIYAGYKFAQAYKEHEEVFGDVMDEIKHEQDIRAKEIEVEAEGDSLSDTEMMKLYGEVVGIGIRHYGPAALSAALSIGLILKGHGLLKGRNQALMAGMAVLEKGFAEYRKRVVEAHGEEEDERLFHGAERQEIVEGKKKGKKRKSRNTIAEEYSPTMYNRVFDETSKEWHNDRELNEFLIRSSTRYFNDILTIRGWVLLNEVYKQFGLPQTPEGAVVGWSLYSKGDDFIDLGADAPINQNVGDNRFVIIPNVNGTVFEYIGQGS